VDVVILLVFVSLVLVAAGLVFFISRLREGDFDHGERLALSPLAKDDGFSASGDDTLDEETTEASRASLTNNDKQSTGNLEGGTLHVGS
jgi:cbb3-type cytochrome oxidase maturation protein